MENTIIVAAATPKGSGGIAILRVSGEGTWNIMKKIFVPAGEMDWQKGFALHYGHIHYEGLTYDEVLLALMKKEASYTREEMAEIQCHGGYLVARRILELLYSLDVAPAAAGEFTKRAFLNGRLDLSQAEAVMETIAAVSRRDLDFSLTRLEGKGRDKIETIQDTLLGLLAKMEVAIDFPEDGLDEMTADEVAETLRSMIIALEEEIQKADIGAVYREGIKTVILGRPNVGKSSLMNALLADDRAIVTDIPGTTRDVIEAQLILGDIPLLIMDTAGLRTAMDPVEKIGLERTHAAAAKSALLLLVIDDIFGPEEEALVETYRDKQILVLINKSDLPRSEESKQALAAAISPLPYLYVSAKERENLDAIGEKIAELFLLGHLEQGADGWVGNRRHKDIFIRAKGRLQEVLAAKEAGMPLDFLTIDLRSALEALNEITGGGEDILDRIFRDFCIGK